MRHPWDAADTIVASRKSWFATSDGGRCSTGEIPSLR
jgi:hypothetical protein